MMCGHTEQETVYTIDRSKLEAFCLQLALEEKSPATIQKYRRDTEHFLRSYPEGAVTKTDVITYKQNLLERYAASSVSSMLISLNRFLRFAGAEECCVKLPRIQRQLFADEDRELERADYLHLLETARDSGQTRLYLLLQTICATGIRVGELRHITLEAARAGSAVVRNKGKTRVILIPQTLRMSILQYAEEQGIAAGPIFVTRGGRPVDRSNIWTAMQKLCRQAGVPARKGFPHNLRHLFARSFYEQEKDITHLADILGHSSLSTTRLYVASSGARHRTQLEALRLAESYRPQDFCRKQHNSTLCCYLDCLSM